MGAGGQRASFARQPHRGQARRAGRVELGLEIGEEQDPLRRHADPLGDAAVGPRIGLRADRGIEMAAEQGVRSPASLCRKKSFCASTEPEL